MSILISSADFVGKFAIPQNSYSDLDSFIEDTEEAYLIDMLGADLWTHFKADLVNKVPVLARYLLIYNALSFDYANRAYSSKGMKEMLLGFIFFDYMRQVKYKATEQGIVVSSSDTTQPVAVGNLYKFLNDASDINNTIQTYIVLKNPSAYNEAGMPVFNGSFKNIAIPIF